MIHSIKYLCFLIFGAAFLSACSLVDEDTSDCEADYTIDYELCLVTNMTTELQTQLSLDTDVAVAAALRDYLSGIFTDYAHDVDLSFYDVEADSLRLHHESHIMDANQSSYTLHIPVRKYMHLALANLANNNLLSVQTDELCHKSTIAQDKADTIGTHSAGLFTARLPMDILENKDQRFDVRLYIANCASALVLDTTGSGIKNMKVYMKGFATDFTVCDSLFRFNYRNGKEQVVVADHVQVSEPGRICFASVNFPSRGLEDTKVIIDDDDPFVSEDAQNALWWMDVYVKAADGSITRSLLGVKKQLHAGQFYAVTGRITDNGTVVPKGSSVAVTVSLNWDDGIHGHVDF